MRNLRRFKRNNSSVRNIHLLAKAYAYAKAGDAESAGELLTEASEDDGLDVVMDAIASSIEGDEDEYEDIEELNASDDSDDDDDDVEDDDDDVEDVDITEVELPASVARLAASTRF